MKFFPTLLFLYFIQICYFFLFGLRTSYFLNIVFLVPVVQTLVVCNKQHYYCFRIEGVQALHFISKNILKSTER